MWKKLIRGAGVLVMLSVLGNATLNQPRIGDIHVDWYPPVLTTLEFHVGEPMSLVAGDFNGDGWQDLIVGVYDANGQPRFSVFYIPGIGEGHFASPSLVAESPVLEGTVQGGGGAGVVSDLDNDGYLDAVNFFTVITINKDGSPTVVNYLLILWGNGDGAFQQQWLEMPLVVYNFMQPVNPVAVGDFDGDGFLDIAYPKFYPPSVEILYNCGSRRWEKVEAFPISAEEEGCVAMPQSIAAADFTSDGKSDLVVGGFCVFGDGEKKIREYRRFVKVFIVRSERQFRETFTYIADVPDITPLAPSLFITDLTGEGGLDLLITQPLRKQEPQEIYLERRWVEEAVVFRGTRTGRLLDPMKLDALGGGILLGIEGNILSYTVVTLTLESGLLGIVQIADSLGGGFTVIEDVIAAALVDIDNDGWIEIVAAVRTWKENATRIVIATRREK